MNIRNLAKSKLNGKACEILSILFNFMPFNNKFKIKGRNNCLDFKGNFLRNSEIIIIGHNNKIFFSQNGKNYLNHCKIKIYGNNNTITFGIRNSLVGVEIWIEDSGNCFILKDNNVLLNDMHIAITEGTQIEFGNNNVISSKCVFRTGDSHSIIEIESGKRINHAESIKFRDRIWLGSNVTILKGVGIESDSMVATGSIVTKKFEESNVIIGGNPAKVLKRGISWVKARI